jgi:iron complex transport system ATP-binding protein
LKDGELVAQGKPSLVLNEELLLHIFGIKARILPNPLNGSPLVLFDR